METTLFYGSPRSIKIGDIFYVIDTRERRDCRAAEILNNAETERLNKYNSEHGTSFAPIWVKTNGPKN